MQTTKYDLAIWDYIVDGETYAFPMGAKDTLGDVIYPKLRTTEWVFKAVLTKGAEVADVKPVKGDRVRCTLAGARGVNTASWAIEDAPAKK